MTVTSATNATPTNTKAKTALILGATGGIGGAVARTLARRGWNIRALSRNAASAMAAQPSYAWRQGDAMIAADVAEAAHGADVIVHAVNPPGYVNWATLVLPMLDNTIAAAKAAGARIVLPGTVYNFGPDAWALLTEDSPQNPRSRKGAIRVAMEERLKAAAAAGTPVIIVRAGDFFGPDAANNWFSQSLVKPGKAISSILYPGRRGVGHQWAYLPDVAETMARLIERTDRLPAFAVYHMRGVWDHNGRQMIAAIEKAVGRKLRVWGFPWFALPALGLFSTFFREVQEMAYLWREPIRMDNARLMAELGEEPYTPIEAAVAATLAGLGCLEAPGRERLQQAEKLMFLA